MFDIKTYPENYKKVLNIIVNGQDFYQFKELEKLAKSEEITPKDLKDILQTLTTEGAVETDKIGTTIYYWSFPHNKFEDDKKMSETLKRQNKELHDKIDVLKSVQKEREDLKKEPNEEEKLKREELTNEIENLKLREAKLTELININENSNADEAKTLKTGIDKLIIAINRWTDNIFNMKSWFKRKFPAVMDENLEKEFRIPSELDYYFI